MSDLKLKQMETKAIASLRQAMSTLMNDAVLPAQMTFPLGDVETERGVYVFEVRVTAEKSKSGLAQIDQQLKEINPDIERKPDDPL